PPILIRSGAELPLLHILAGGNGGLVANGVLGNFNGPTVLAVAYTLLNAWIAEAEGPSRPEGEQGISSENADGVG
ncbi:AI-2E family transporter, partial [Rhizobiaceae sp. 2RAB30]